MITEALVAYITDERAKNIPDVDIKAALMAQGWKESDVIAALGGERPRVPLPSIGVLLEETFVAFSSRAKLLVLLSLPWAVFSMIVAILTYDADARSFSVEMVVALFLSIVFMIFLSVLATVSTIISLSDDSIVDPVVAWKRGLSAFWRYLGTSIVSGLWILVGFLLLIIPGFYFMIRVLFSGIASILDGTGPIKSMAKSESYVKGRWWSVAWRFVAGALLFTITGSMVNGMSELGMVFVPETRIPLIVFSAMFGVLVSIFTTIYLYVLYVHASGKKGS